MLFHKLLYINKANQSLRSLLKTLVLIKNTELTITPRIKCTKI